MSAGEIGVELRGVLLLVLDPDLLLAGLVAHLDLEGDDLPDFLVRPIERVEHERLVDLARARLDHHDRMLGPGHDQVEVGNVTLRVRRIDDQLPVDGSHADGRDRIREGDRRDGESSGRGIEREDVGIVLAVGREDEGDDLRLLPVSLLEGGAERPVDQARGESFLFGRTPFALEEAARDATARVGELAVVDGQRHEVAQDGAFLVAGGGENDGVAVADPAGAIGLLGDLAGFEGQRATADFDFLLICHIHFHGAPARHSGPLAQTSDRRGSGREGTKAFRVPRSTRSFAEPGTRNAASTRVTCGSRACR